METTEAETIYVYAIGAAGHQAVKIGYAAQPRKRLADLQIGCPLALVLRWAFPAESATHVERALHKRFVRQRIRGEWFDLGPDGALIAQQAFAQITGQPDLEPPFESVMAEPARLFLADIRPWATAVPKWAKHVTVEHLHQQLRATGIPRWQDTDVVTVGRMLCHLFEDKFYTPTRQYNVGTVRVALLRKAAQEMAG